MTNDTKKRNLMNAREFDRIKKFLSDNANNITATAKKFKRSWDTVARVNRADSLEQYWDNHGTVVKLENPLIAQLRQQQADMNRQFDDMIATLERLERL